MADSALLKEISIKTRVVKRLTKELACYEKEAEQECSKLESMKSKADADEYLIKKQAEVLQESQQMIPDCKRRIERAVDELKKIIEGSLSTIEGTKELEEAQAQLEAVSDMK
ncbi:hypothetical protein AB6A40_008472 [Gnathostoma spinigerum]|uniref:Tubulin-specific chaperone A n=1 Tax=Gnathostoma spinigerum TaxID=75299 RepID=A0ABD6EXG3_9BILA